MVQIEERKQQQSQRITPAESILVEPEVTTEPDINDSSISIDRHDIHFQKSTLLEVSDTLSDRDPGSRIYIASASQARALSYHYGPQEEAISARIQQLRNPHVSSHKAQTADKVETREISDSLGSLSGTEWIDLGSHLSGRGHELHFHSIDLATLPIEDLIDPNTTTDKLIVEGKRNGFILGYEDGGFVLETENDYVANISGGNIVRLSPEMLQDTLKRLQESDYTIIHPGHENGIIRRKQFESVVQSLEDGTWFLKDTGGSRGNQVVKLEVLDSKIVKARASSLQHELIADYNGTSIDDITPEMVIDFMYLDGNDYGSPIEKGILEKGIPTISVNGVRSEQRAIFAFAGDPYYLCSYSKVSSGIDSMPNISQDGSGEAIRTSFTRILKDQGISEAGLSQVVEDTVTRMKELTSAFAKEFTDIARERGYLYGPHFGIDICPIWNHTQQQIDFVLLEVQAGPGTEGSHGNLPADEVVAVEAYDKKNAEDDFDLMY